MKTAQRYTAIAAFLGMLALILDGKTAVTGAASGIRLCLEVAIPSLFPFFLLSNILTSALMGSAFPFLIPVRKLCFLPPGTESILIAGFFGGYPIGAQVIATYYRSGQITKANAERMLSFCSNAGPAFFFGIVSSLFTQRWISWCLWIIHILSALMVSRCFPAPLSAPITLSIPHQVSCTQALRISIQAMGSVCGWIVVFRTLIAFLDRWFLWLLPAGLQVIVIGLLELVNGCCNLASVPDFRIRFILCSVILAFGGLCVAMQTVSVTQGLCLRNYWKGKLLQALLSLILSILAIYQLWIAILLIIALFYLFPWKLQNNSSIQPLTGV